MRHPESKCHAIPRLKCQSTLASIRYQITIFGSTDPSPTINVAHSLLGTNGTFPWQSSIIDSLRSRKGGLRLKLCRSYGASGVELASIGAEVNRSMEPPDAKAEAA
jgi:hypothetical protein